MDPDLRAFILMACPPTPEQLDLQMVQWIQIREPVGNR
jgi:hypothetical protein